MHVDVQERVFLATIIRLFDERPASAVYRDKCPVPRFSLSLGDVSPRNEGWTPRRREGVDSSQPSANSAVSLSLRGHDDYKPRRRASSLLTHFASPSAILVVLDGIDSLRNDQIRPPPIGRVRFHRFHRDGRGGRNWRSSSSSLKKRLLRFLVNYVTSRHAQVGILHGNHRFQPRLFIYLKLTYTLPWFPHIAANIVKRARASLCARDIARIYRALYKSIHRWHESRRKVQRKYFTIVAFTIAPRTILYLPAMLQRIARIVVQSVFEFLLVTFAKISPIL